MSDPGSSKTEGNGSITHPPITKTSFHSPSAILGTPIDPTARFEYPFPSPDAAQAAQQYIPSFFDVAHRPIGSFVSNTPFPPWQSQDPSVKHRTFLHPKHVVQEPPIPPSLAKNHLFFKLRLPKGRAAFNRGGIASGKIPPGAGAKSEDGSPAKT